jgi:hypothetical protein
MRAVEEYLADVIADRIVSEGYYRPSWRSPYWRPYYPAYRPYSSTLDYEIRRILSYHDYINKYEIVNRILSHTLDPKLEEVLGVLYDLINGKGAASSGKAANATAPAKTLLQIESQGVPVFVDPVLIKNEMTDADLSQRDYIIDGINGIAFTQVKDEEDDKLVLNIEGKNIEVTPDESFVQLDNPVENPPFNNWSVNQPSPPHDRGMRGNEDLGLRDIVIDGINGFSLVQVDQSLKNPVDNPPFNNWSVNQPSPPHDRGLRGKEDLGVKDIIIDGVNGFAFA